MEPTGSPLATEGQNTGPQPMSAAPQSSNTKKFALLGGIALLLIVGGVAAFFGKDWFKPALAEPLQVGIIQNVKHLDTIIDSFKTGLTELGYAEGTAIVYEYQNVDGDNARAKEVAAGYVARDVDLILAVTTPTIQMAYEATVEAGKPIPVLFTNGVGLIPAGTSASYASSGNNVTGIVPDDIEVTVKKLEFLKRFDPDAKKVGVFYSSIPATGAATLAIEELRKAAPQFGVEIITYDIKSPPTPASTVAMQKIADGIKPGDIDAIITIPEVVSNYQDNPKILIALSKRIKAPILFLTVPRVFEGGLLSYSQDYVEYGKQAAAMAHKIFQGTAPQDIPIEFTHKNNLIINLKTAKELGITIPDSLLSIADQVIPAE
jgi:putative ABC transport system substrate-binding protein